MFFSPRNKSISFKPRPIINKKVIYVTLNVVKPAKDPSSVSEYSITLGKSSKQEPVIGVAVSEIGGAHG